MQTKTIQAVYQLYKRYIMRKTIVNIATVCVNNRRAELKSLLKDTKTLIFIMFIGYYKTSKILYNLQSKILNTKNMLFIYYYLFRKSFL